MQHILRRGARGPAVERLQLALREVGFNPGAIDGRFGHATEAALIAFQRAHGLLADGIAGPLTWARLDGSGPAAPIDVTDQVSVDLVADMFPFTRLDPIVRHLPALLDALRQFQLIDKPMVLMALATIRAETEAFEPVDELPSRYNTSPHGHPFDLYDNRIDLGNRGRPDGARFKGRGFIQLTGRDNYRRIGRQLGLGDRLERQPEIANEPKIAALVLGCFLAARRQPIKQALLEDDLARARRLVNGGRHGLERFTLAYRIGEQQLVDPVWSPLPMLADALDYAPAQSVPVVA